MSTYNGCTESKCKNCDFYDECRFTSYMKEDDADETKEESDDDNSAM